MTKIRDLYLCDKCNIEINFRDVYKIFINMMLSKVIMKDYCHECYHKVEKIILELDL